MALSVSVEQTRHPTRLQPLFSVSAGTQHRRQREVKAFFSWCRRMDYVEENPFMRVPMVRREQKVVHRRLQQSTT